jgi:rhodanese-related sulfurtransferase
VRLARGAAWRSGLLVGALLFAGGCSLRRWAESRPPFRRVTASVAFEMMRDSPDELLILDLREPQEHDGALGRIYRAYNIPLAQLPWRLSELAAYRQHTFLVYCRNDDCGPTGMAILVSSGFESAVLIDGGIESWVEAGFGTVGVTPPAVGGDGEPATAVADAPAVAPTPPAPAAPVPDTATAPRAYLRLSDGSLLLAAHGPPPGLHLVGSIGEEGFEPEGAIAGEGPTCEEFSRLAGSPGHPGWRELRDGTFHGDETGRAPRAPFVHGCLGADGFFRPDGRDFVTAAPPPS